MNKRIAKRLIMKPKLLWLMALMCAVIPAFATDDVVHKYAENNGVKIHYAATGRGSLVVFIHGFPDFWYSWRHQMLVKHQ
jgi:epoxide hydrolase 4